MIFKRHLGSPGDMWPQDMPRLCWTPVTAAAQEIFDGMKRPGYVVAIITCKNGHACALRVPPHTVSPSGEVNPSLGCPVKGCDGHEVAGSVLSGWGT